MKSPIKIYLESSTIKKLRSKAEESGFEGRAWLSKYLEFIASRDIAFLDENVRKILRAIRLRPEKVPND